jgi:hypothetical protein
MIKLSDLETIVLDYTDEMQLRCLPNCGRDNHGAHKFIQNIFEAGAAIISKLDHNGTVV